MSNYKKYIDKYDENKYIQEQDDFIIAKGGDGTLLRAISILRHKNKPFFGIAAGTLNFLMNTEHSIGSFSQKIKFTLIKVKVTYTKSSKNVLGFAIEQTVTEEFQGFNDCVIGGTMNDYIYFDMRDEDEIIGKFSGGGMIISTAQGSTGINKNNGGVILPLSSDHWVVTGDKVNRHINYVISSKKTEINFKARTPVTVWVDGANNIIHNASKIEISQGDTVEVIFNNYQEFKQKRRI